MRHPAITTQVVDVLDLQSATAGIWTTEGGTKIHARVEIGTVCVTVMDGTTFVDLADTLERLASDLRVKALEVRVADFYKANPDLAPTADDMRGDLHDLGIDDEAA